MSVEKVVGMTIWRLATCCDLRTIGNLFGVHRSTVCRAVYQVCQTIVDVMYHDYIVWPTGERLQETIQGFSQEHGFPQCGGAIDGSHIPIKAPHISTADYYNRKGWYSMILQAVVDHKLRFIDVNVGWPGKVHDARVFRNSSIYERGQRGQLFPREASVEMEGIDIPVFIIGDPAYPLLPWLMKGFPEGANFNRQQRTFNYRLSRARMVVEQAFGQLKGRWRILMRRNDTHVSKVPLMVSSCCVLHNFCISQNDEVELEEIHVNEENINEDDPLPDALDIRTTLVNYCNTHPL
ncbi:uncharacterized protein [Antedon mediterranea]|uniref:uncharacterized protein n=1 Tax=Antedon mediterranea TaxID=105859 RepID=UPI003AF8A3D0